MAGSRVASMPKAKIGRTSQPNANAVKTAVASSTAAARARQAAQPPGVLQQFRATEPLEQPDTGGTTR